MQSLRIQLQKKFVNISRIKGDGISAIKLEAAQIHLLSDVFVAVTIAVVVAKGPYYLPGDLRGREGGGGRRNFLLQTFFF